MNTSPIASLSLRMDDIKLCVGLWAHDREFPSATLIFVITVGKMSVTCGSTVSDTTLVKVANIIMGLSTIWHLQLFTYLFNWSQLACLIVKLSGQMVLQLSLGSMGISYSRCLNKLGKWMNFCMVERN